MNAIAQKIRDHASLMRPINSTAIGMAVIAGEIVALGVLPAPKEAMLGFLTGFFVSSSSMVFNDYFDVEVDRVNAPNRPLPSGRMHLREALTAGFSWASMGILCSIFLGPVNLLIAVVFWAVAILYNSLGKATGLMGNFMVSVSVAIPYVFGGAAVGRPLDSVIVMFFSISLLANMGREVAKGIMDVEGDAARGIKTVALRHGVSMASKLTSIFLFASIILSWLPYVFGWLGIPYLIFIAVADVVIAHSGIRVLSKRGSKEIGSIKAEILVGMFLGLLAFIAGGLTR
ncbi:MAG: UbiA family prenyltransferase [Candidatus Geothermarchaeales archaeon]